MAQKTDASVKEAERTSPSAQAAVPRAAPRLATPSDLSEDSVALLSQALNTLVSEVFALYVKTKNFHWHVSGPHFRDYHLLLDEQAEQIFVMVDPIAERVRRLGGITIHSLAQMVRLSKLKENEEDFVDPRDMLLELRHDNRYLIARMREIHDLCNELHDVATASLLEVWIDEGEKRLWFLFEASRTPSAAPALKASS